MKAPVGEPCGRSAAATVITEEVEPGKFGRRLCWRALEVAKRAATLERPVEAARKSSVCDRTGKIDRVIETVVGA